jgi:hypothetical protein
MRKKILLFITIFILTGFSAIAQDPLFSSTIDNPLSVRRVIPPTTTIAKMVAQTVVSHMAIVLF